MLNVGRASLPAADGEGVGAGVELSGEFSGVGAGGVGAGGVGVDSGVAVGSRGGLGAGVGEGGF